MPPPSSADKNDTNHFLIADVGEGDNDETKQINFSKTTSLVASLIAKTKSNRTGKGSTTSPYPRTNYGRDSMDNRDSRGYKNAYYPESSRIRRHSTDQKSKTGYNSSNFSSYSTTYKKYSASATDDSRGKIKDNGDNRNIHYRESWKFSSYGTKYNDSKYNSKPYYSRDRRNSYYQNGDDKNNERPLKRPRSEYLYDQRDPRVEYNFDDPCRKKVNLEKYTYEKRSRMKEGSSHYGGRSTNHPQRSVQLTEPAQLTEEDQIIKQVEFYFSDYNLPQDKFMSEAIGRNDGYLNIDTLMTFNRMRQYYPISKVINALQKSEMLEFDSNIVAIRRKRRYNETRVWKKDMKEFISRCVFISGFPVDKYPSRDNADWQLVIEEFISLYTFGYPINQVRLVKRPFIQPDGECIRLFVGRCFIEFSRESQALDFLELNPKFEDIKLEIMRKSVRTQMNYARRRNGFMSGEEKSNNKFGFKKSFSVTGIKLASPGFGGSRRGGSTSSFNYGKRVGGSSGSRRGRKAIPSFDKLRGSNSSPLGPRKINSNKVVASPSVNTSSSALSGRSSTYTPKNPFEGRDIPPTQSFDELNSCKKRSSK